METTSLLHQSLYKGNHLVQYYPSVANEKEYVIPEGIEYIDSHAFDFAPTGLRIYLPKTLKRIAFDVFLPGDEEKFDIIVPEGVGKDYPFANGEVTLHSLFQEFYDELKDKI